MGTAIVAHMARFTEAVRESTLLFVTERGFTLLLHFEKETFIDDVCENSV